MISYRKASTNDLTSICAIGNEVHQIHHAAWPQIFAPVGSVERDRAFWAKDIDTPNAATFVAERNTQIIGFIAVAVVTEASSLMQPMTYGRIGSVSVTAEHRGKGVGRALVALAEQWAATFGAVDMRLQVWTFNERAIALYEELGYSVRSHFLGRQLPTTESGG